MWATSSRLSSSSSMTRMRLDSAMDVAAPCSEPCLNGRTGGRPGLLDRDSLDLYPGLGAVSIDGRLADPIDDVHPLDHLAEDRELAGQGGLVGQADEELVPGAVLARGTQHRRHRAARHRPVGQ